MEVIKIIKRHGFTQKEVAEKMGIRQNTLSELINMRHSKPTPKTLRKIAEIIGADYSEFFEDEVPMRDQLRVEREQLELKRLRLQHKISKLPDMVPVAALDKAIDGGTVTLDGRRYRQMFIPLDE
jgi:transcriptional regulator with XRE-family HTH domain